MSAVVAYTAYPVVICIGFMAHHFAEHVVGVPLVFSANIAIGFTSWLVLALEFSLPARKEWLPKWSDFLNDGCFMVVVQVLVPNILTLYVATTLVDALSAHQLTVASLWPSGWPIAAQVMLMMVCAEFFRYWMHRAFHEWPTAWRLHAVHHSPHKLYWLNVGRFHPIEKSIQFLADTLPFIVLGVSPDVLANYMVFYAINGFFQHSNIAVRLGWLNYLISGPELHRWHHSVKINESNSNYGNNLIVWDLVFGTWFLPPERVVGELGLINRQYPTSFVAQMQTPFVKGLDKRVE